MTRRRSQCRGFVLLMTVLVLAVVAVAMLGLSRRSLDRAADAMQAQGDLQRRWAALSCQRTLLPRAAAALKLAQQRDASATGARLTIALGGQSLALVFADEQARANVNALYVQAGKRGADMAVRRLMQAAGVDAEVALRPWNAPATNGAPQDPVQRAALPRFGSFSQVFADGDSDPVAMFDAPASGARGIDARGIGAGLPLTCWGDGRLYFAGARRAAIEVMCAGLLGAGDVDRLVMIGRQQPDAALDDVLAQLDVSAPRRAKLAQRLTDQSACQSLRITIGDGPRRWRRLMIVERGRQTRVLTFQW